MDIVAERLLGETLVRHWVYRAKGDALRRLLNEVALRHVLDVGGGSGVFARLLLDHGAAEATCVDPAYPAQFETRHNGKPIRFVHQVEDSSADVVLMIDVLALAEDDEGMLRHYANSAAPGTRFLISVPAYAWLWSGHDVACGHQRRYTLAGLEALVRDAGLRPVTGCYFYGLTLPLTAARLAARRLTGRGADAVKPDLKRHAKWANTLLYALCRMELPMLRHNRVAGLTVFCLAER
jgi:SAM-dependent methyltransferase